MKFTTKCTAVIVGCIMLLGACSSGNKGSESQAKTAEPAYCAQMRTFWSNMQEEGLTFTKLVQSGMPTSDVGKAMVKSFAVLPPRDDTGAYEPALSYIAQMNGEQADPSKKVLKSAMMLDEDLSHDECGS